MTLKEITNKIVGLAEKLPNHGSIAIGDVYEFNHKQNVRYPAFCITNNEHDYNVDENTITYNFYLFLFDRLTSNGDNKLNVQSNTMSDLIKIVDALSDFCIVNTSTFTNFNERLNDVCSGTMCNLSLTVENNNCNELKLK